MRTLDEHIDATPGISSGRPRVAGHRITIRDIAVWHERVGMSADEIASDYDLTLAEVYAALAYYFDHRDEIDRDVEETQALIDALRERTPSKLQRKLNEQASSASED